MAAGTRQSGSGPHAVRNYPPRQSARLGRARISSHAFAPTSMRHGLTARRDGLAGVPTRAPSLGGAWRPPARISLVAGQDVGRPDVGRCADGVVRRVSLGAEVRDFSKRGDRRRHQLIGGCGGAESPGRVRPPAVHTPDDARDAAGMHGSAADSGEGESAGDGHGRVGRARGETGVVESVWRITHGSPRAATEAR